MTTRTKPKTGVVVFIGAGPGDPGLLTLRAADLLSVADAVAVPEVLRPVVLPRCREDVEILDITDHDGAVTGKALAAVAKTGKLVARVLPGDPTVMCDFAEEADACAKAKVAFELVPGISSAFAVPAYAGVPVTDRRNRTVHVVDVASGADEPDWASLAGPRQTLVLLNCAGVLGKVSASLVEHGWKGDTPVAVTAAGTTTAQHTVVSTLETVERDSVPLDGPSVAVVGDVVKL
ncbi:MAG TPA: SAM-dependent methyltransferase, partial [Mycobacteriales bacterium]|nr:SAM-dependent methyltransferase [Mycobacteriales bacterium]